MTKENEEKMIEASKRILKSRVTYLGLYNVVERMLHIMQDFELIDEFDCVDSDIIRKEIKKIKNAITTIEEITVLKEEQLPL